MIRLFSIVFFYFFVTSIYAQNLVLSKQETIEKLKPTLYFYQSSERFFFKTKVTSFDDAKTPIPYEAMSGYYFQDGLCLHSYSMGIELVQNDQLRVVIDSTSRQMLISEPEQSPIISDQQIEYSVMNSDSIFYDEIKNQGKTSYYFKYPKGGKLSAIYMELNKDASIGKYVMYYQEIAYENEQGKVEKKEPRVEINYELLLRPLNKGEICPLNNFLINEGGQWKAIKPYDNYKLIDSRNNK